MLTAMKLHMLEHLEKAGSFEYTRKTLERLQEQMNDQLHKVEKMTDCENWILRLLLYKLGL